MTCAQIFGKVLEGHSVFTFFQRLSTFWTFLSPTKRKHAKFQVTSEELTRQP